MSVNPLQFRAVAMCLLCLFAGEVRSATFTVTNTNSAGAGSLREAVIQANATPAADTIVFDTAGVFSTTQTITLAGAQIAITAPVTINAPSAAGRRVTIDAADQSRIFNVQLAAAGTVTLNNLAMRNGNTADDGGAIVVNSPAGSSLVLTNSSIFVCRARDGGAIFSGTAALTLTDTSIENNDATRHGGGVFSGGNVTMTNGEFAGNAAPGDGGGILLDGGTSSFTGVAITANTAANGAGLQAKGGAIVAISGGTVTHNTADQVGGGLRAAGSSTLLLLGVMVDLNNADLGAGIYIRNSTLSAVNCRITRNDASVWGGGLYFSSGVVELKNCTVSGNTGVIGAGIYAETNGVALGNTVVANNPTYGSKDLVGPFATLGHNFIGNLDTATGFANGVDGDIVGERSTLDARLDLSTFTPLSRSRCLENGDSSMVSAGTYGTAPYVDFLGNPRIRGVVDIGAIEGTFNAIITNANDSGAGSLRDALASTPTDISFDPTFFATLRTITLTSGQITLSTDLSIVGPAPGLRISGNNASRVFNVTAGNVLLQRVRVIDGAAAGDGGGIRVINAGTSLTLDDAGVSNSTATGRGGGLYVQDASTVIATNSTFSNNTADGDGGGIHINGATFNVTNSTISTNSSKGGGGGIYAGGTNTTTVINCTIADNTCDSDAGGAAGNGGGIRRFAGTVNVGNTIVARNADASASIIHPDVSGIFTSLGHNLIGKLDGIDGTGGVPFQNGTNGDLAGTIASPLAPGLNALQQNPAASPTRVHPLQAGSPARDAGDAALLSNAAWLSSPVARDQRGQFRTVGSVVDIGAVEYPDTNLVKISVEDSVMSEFSAREAVFKIRRSFDDGANLVVNLTLTGSTAVPSDYTFSGASYASTGANTLTVTIPAGSTYVLLNSTATQDANVEGLETVALNVVAGAGYGLDSGATNVAVATIYDDEYNVTSGADSGAGSLREAVDNANIAGGGVITLPTNLNVALSSGRINLLSEIEIVGNHATLNGNGVTAVLYANRPYGDPIVISDLVITGGNTTASGGGIFVEYATDLVMTGCTVKGNVASASAGGIAVDYIATLTMTDCAVVDNTTSGTAGGIYASQGDVTLTNCTVAGNSAGGSGGGIYVYDSNVELTGCTFTQNIANSGLTFSIGGGGGVHSGFNAVVTLVNTVVAGNFDTTNNSGTGTLAPDVGGSGALTGSFNFIGTNAGNGLVAGQPNVANNYVGTAATPLDPKLIRIDGPKDTYYEFAYDSALKDHGSNALAVGTTDQRGIGRQFGARVDIGSVEMDFYLVTSTTDIAFAGTLRSAVNLANAAGHGTIVFDPGTFGVPQTISTTLGDLLVTGSLVVQGPTDPAAQLTISGGGLRRAFRIQPGSPKQVELRNVDIINGIGAGGGGVLVDGSSTLIMTNCDVRNCSSSANGGAVLVAAGSTLRASDGTFSGNSTTGLGGAIQSSGTVVIERATFSANTATTNGGAVSSTSVGLLVNCTFSDNRANNHGGAIYQAGTATDTLALTHCTLTLNRANDDNTGGGSGGGARQQSGFLAVKNTIISGNDALGNTQDDISGAFTSFGNNLVGIITGGTGFTNNVNGDLVGANAYLGPLQNNGGPTFTHAIGAGSAAVNAASTIAGLTDQRGLARTGSRDIGAYELQPETYSYWAAHTFPSAVNAGAAADWDGDGFTNGAEYAAGSDPLAAASQPRISVTSVGSQLEVSWSLSPLLATGTYTLQTSTDLVIWTPVAPTGYSFPGADASGLNRLVRVTAPSGPQRTFARVRFAP